MTERKQEIEKQNIPLKINKNQSSKGLGQEYLQYIKQYKKKLREQQSNESLIGQNGQNTIQSTHNNQQKNQLNHQLRQSTSHHKQNRYFWEIFMFAFIKFKQAPFQISEFHFKTVCREILLGVQQNSQQLKQTQSKSLCQRRLPELTQLVNNSNNNHQSKLKSPSQTHLINNNFQKDIASEHFHPPPELLQRRLQDIQHIPQISRQLREQLIQQISLIQDMLNLQLIVSIYTYINIYSWTRFHKFINHHILYLLEKKFKALEKAQVVDWHKVQTMEENLQSSQEISNSTTQSKQIITTNNEPKMHSQSFFIKQYIRYKFQLGKFLMQEEKKNCKSRNTIKKLNSFFGMATFHPNFGEFDISYYFHSLHKAAHKRKHFLIANILHSKCFTCSAERFISNSIHEVRIYQKFMRKFNNLLQNQHEDF